MTTRTRWIATGAVVLLVAAVIALFGGIQVERYEVAYPSIVQARAEEAVDRGWIPEWIPEEATDLREVHDTGNTAALFRAELPAGVETPDACTDAGSIAPPPTLSANWFPDDAETRGDPLQCDDWVGVRADATLLLWRP